MDRQLTLGQRQITAYATDDATDDAADDWPRFDDYGPTMHCPPPDRLMNTAAWLLSLETHGVDWGGWRDAEGWPRAPQNAEYHPDDREMSYRSRIAQVEQHEQALGSTAAFDVPEPDTFIGNAP